MIHHGATEDSRRTIGKWIRCLSVPSLSAFFVVVCFFVLGQTYKPERAELDNRIASWLLAPYLVLVPVGIVTAIVGIATAAGASIRYRSFRAVMTQNWLIIFAASIASAIDIKVYFLLSKL